MRQWNNKFGSAVARNVFLRRARSLVEASTFVSAAAVFQVMFTPIAPARAEVQGEPEAIETVHAIVETVGGRERWVSARSLYAKLRGYPSDEPGGGIEEVWTDLQTPDVYFRFETDANRTVRVTRANSGWSLRNGEYAEISPERARDFARFWAYSEYVLYHRFAKGDPTLRVARAGKDRLELFDAQSGDAFGWLQLNADNEVVKWHAPFGDDITIEYVFGPFAQFGDIRMPKWGAQTEGDFRFENLEFELSDRPPPVSFDPPDEKQD